MLGGWQAAGLLVSMVGTQGDIESRPPHHGEPFLYSHPHTPQHCWCNASRPPLQVISRKTSNCGTRLKTWLAARREAGGGDGRPQCEGGKGGREVGKRGAGSRLGWQASYTAGASSAARAVARGARRCRPCGASTTLPVLPAWTGTGLTALELIETGWQDSGGCHHLEEQLMAEGGGTLGMKGNANA